MHPKMSGSFGNMHQGTTPVNARNISPAPVTSQYVASVPPMQCVMSNVPFVAPYAVPTFQVPPVPPQVAAPNPGLLASYGQWFPGQPFVSGFPNAAVQPDEADKTKWVEQQKKFMKERAFLAQQQKLKQFDVSNAKSDMLSKVLLENMFGKSSVKETRGSGLSSVPTQRDVSEQVLSVAAPNTSVDTATQSPKLNRSDVDGSKRTLATAPKTDPKALEHMMLECSNLSASPKAKPFKKPALIQQETMVKPPSVQSVTSLKARDWQSLQLDELGEMFTIKKPRFPHWCCKEKVPHLYLLVEEQATGKGSHDIDTNILYPILVSSHLPRDMLCRIWEMVNQTTPGQLTCEELYAALALISIAQAGNPVPSTDVLHMLPQPPVPILQAFLPAPSLVHTTLATPEAGTPTTGNLFFPTYSYPSGIRVGTSADSGLKASSVSPAQSGSQMIGPVPQASCQRPSETVASSSASLFSSQTKISGVEPSEGNNEDEFDDFKSASVLPFDQIAMVTTTTATKTEPEKGNVALPSDNDDFADFKQANIPRPSGISQSVSPPQSLTDSKKDLMAAEEDKYSIFRIIQSESQEVGSWSILNTNQDAPQDNVSLSSPVNSETSLKQMSQIVSAEEGEMVDQLTNPTTDRSKEKEVIEEEFGDFLCAMAESGMNVQTDAEIITPTQEQSMIECNFANFDQFQNAITYADDEFGNFTSFDVNFAVPGGMLTETGTSNIIPIIEDFDNLSLNQVCSFDKPEGSSDGTVQGSTKDNLSSAESQSISSLELASYDVTPGQTGDSKSSISRHGSVPSLDLKGAGVEGVEVEEGFGDTLTPPFPAYSAKFTKQASLSACSSPDVNRMRENSSPLPLAPLFGSVTLLSDRYSSIRPPTKAEDSDRHISEWMRCLRSCLSIFEAANKIFGQISSSAVCAEVLGTLEGSDYVKNLIEVYKVVARISSSTQSVGKKTEKLKALFCDIECAWQNLVAYANSPLIPPANQSLSSAAAEPTLASENAEACGICLLSVEHSAKETNEMVKLFYGGRQYHTTCANLWVNCVEPLLPSLPLPQLL